MLVSANENVRQWLWETFNHSFCLYNKLHDKISYLKYIFSGLNTLCSFTKYLTAEVSLGNVKYIFDQRKNLDYKILYNMLTYDLNYLELKNLIFRNQDTYVPGLPGLVEVVKKLIELQRRLRKETLIKPTCLCLKIRIFHRTRTKPWNY